MYRLTSPFQSFLGNPILGFFLVMKPFYMLSETCSLGFTLLIIHDNNKNG